MQALPSTVLLQIFTHLPAVQVAQISCLCSTWKHAACDEVFWKTACETDWLEVKVEPSLYDGEPCGTFKEMYISFHKEFSMYGDMYIRVKTIHSNLKSWAMSNFPEILDTFQEGASEQRLLEAEEQLGKVLPLGLRLFYKFFNGQTNFFTISHEQQFGLFGCYNFYDYSVSTHFLGLKPAIQLGNTFSKSPLLKSRFPFGLSFGPPRMLFLDTSTGIVSAFSRGFEFPPIQCVPGPEDEVGPTGRLSGEAFVRWIEEYVRRLQSGIYGVREISTTSGEPSGKGISLFPELPPLCTTAVTRGIQIRCSGVLVPEASSHENGGFKLLFTYSVRMRLLKKENPQDYEKVQLRSRHWIVKAGDQILDEVRGEAVIGHYPILTEGGPEFVYQSCTTMTANGSMEGSFQFVPGSLANPEGEEFSAVIAPFPLESPEFVF